MNIFELSEQARVSIGALQRIQALGCLIVEGTVHPVYIKTIDACRNRNRLSAEMLLYLVKNPDWLNRLGKYEMRARVEVAELGEVMADRMPADDAAEIAAMANGDIEAIEHGAAWIKRLIDTSAAFDDMEQGHAFIAVRMLADLPEAVYPYNVPAIAKALWNCRRHPLLKGYSHIDENKRTLYRRPLSGLDL